VAGAPPSYAESAPEEAVAAGTACSGRASISQDGVGVGRRPGDVSGASPALPADFGLAEQHEAALWRTSAAAEGARSRVAEEVASIQHFWSQHSHEFDQYTQQPLPTTYAELEQKNKMREKLLPVVEELRRVQEFLLVSDASPMDVLHAEQNAALASVDGLMERLGAIRASVLQRFHEKQAEIEADHRVARSAAVGFAPMMEHIDGFMRRYSKEVEHEMAKSQTINEQRLEQLKREVLVFISANESPATNPAFARAQEDIIATEARLREHQSASCAASDVLRRWDELHAKIPTGVVAVVPQASSSESSTGARRSWWSRFWPRGQKRPREATE